jgi:hypothetical protein
VPASVFLCSAAGGSHVGAAFDVLSRFALFGVLRYGPSR